MFLLGETRDECGGSEAALAIGLELETVPRTDLAKNAACYQAFVAARDQGLIRSADAVTRGGLALALTRAAMAGGLGVEIEIDTLDASLGLFAALFSESTGRLLITCAPGDTEALERHLGAHHLVPLGTIAAPRAGSGYLRVSRGGKALLDLDTKTLRKPFHEGLHGV